MRWRDQFDLPGWFSDRVPPFTVEVGVALALTAFAVGIRWLGGMVLPGLAEFPVAFPAVAVATLLAGARAGTIVIILYQLYVSVGIDGARYSVFARTPAASVSVVLIVASQAMIVWLVSIYRQFAQRTAALERENAAELQRSRLALARQLELEQLLRSQNQELAQAKHYLEAIYQASGEGLVLAEAIRGTDGRLVDYRVLEVNRAHESLTGMSRDLLLSTSKRAALPEVDERLFSSASDALETGELQQFDLYLEATRCWLNIRVSRVSDRLFQQTFVDVTDRHRLDVQRQSLVKEMSHRVLNNFQMITGFLQLQAMDATPDVRQQLNLAVSRIQVIAKLHTLLAYSASDTEIDGGSYLHELCQYLAETIDRPDAIRIACDCGMIMLDTDIVAPLGLITSELVMNAIKYAFPAPASGTITVRLAREGSGIRLTIEDDGVGMAANSNEAGETATRGGLGMRLVQIFVRQLNASLETRSEHGVRHVLVFGT